MNKKQVVKAVATAVVIAELAVLDYAAWRLMKDGISIEISTEELTEAEEAAAADMAGEL